MLLAAAVCLVTVLPVALILGASMRPKNAVAAERVLDPDRMYASAPAPAPIELPLMEGELTRFPTSYVGRTEKLTVGQADLHKGYLVLVNSHYPLPEDYVAEGLLVLNEEMDGTDSAGFSVNRSRMVINATAGERLLALTDAASEEAGIRGYLMQSGHRDFAYQSNLHNRKVQEYKNLGYGEDDAVKAAAFWVARPKQSEHHTGLAADVASRGHPDLTPSYAYTDHGRWLAANSWRFGFIIRYPEGKSDITMVGYEPWHLRYVGTPHSELMTSQGWSLEEYIDFLAAEGGVTFRDGGGTIWQIDFKPFVEGAIDVPSGLPYAISGDGGRGFVVTVQVE